MKNIFMYRLMNKFWKDYWHKFIGELQIIKVNGILQMFDIYYTETQV